MWVCVLNLFIYLLNLFYFIHFIIKILTIAVGRPNNDLVEVTVVDAGTSFVEIKDEDDDEGGDNTDDDDAHLKNLSPVEWNENHGRIYIITCSSVSG